MQCGRTHFTPYYLEVRALAPRSLALAPLGLRGLYATEVPRIRYQNERWPRHRIAAHAFGESAEHTSVRASLCLKRSCLLVLRRNSVEIVPGDGSDWPAGCVGLEEDHRPFLFIEGNLGVPQKVLYRLYVVAVREFTRARPTYRHTTQLAASNVERLAHLSAIILLANSAHQTAFNLRKNLVVSGSLDAERELQLCAALLVVRENAKQNLLWHHRRWLLHRVYPPSNASTKTPCANQLSDTLRNVTLPAGALRAEFSIAAQACETYPRNYFAWTHRHLCLEALVCLASTSSPAQDAYCALLLEEMLFARTWIERHVSDYTAVDYIHGMHVLLLRELIVPLPEDAPEKLGVDPVDSKTLRAMVYAHAKGLLEAYPEHESMWLYLRAAMDLRKSDPESQLSEKHTMDEPPAETSSSLKTAASMHAKRHRAWLLRCGQGQNDT